MKKQQKGDATGRPNARWWLLAHPDAKFFCGKCGLGSLGEKEHGTENLGEIFSFCFSSLALTTWLRFTELLDEQWTRLGLGATKGVQ